MFSLMTVLCWGFYGIFLHSGQLGMNDPVHGRYKAFLCVGLAYFLTAVLAPLLLLLLKGASWSYPWRGFSWSLLAGIVGAVIAVPVVAVLYSSIRFWVNTGSRAGFSPPPSDPTGTGAALP